MKKVFFLSPAFVFLAVACYSRFAAGIVAGEPTGITAKYWLDRNSAFDATAAWSFRGSGMVHLHADYLYHFSDLKPMEEIGKFPFYVGLGALIDFGQDGSAGFRFPVGGEYIFSKLPLGIFLEFAPVMNVLPATELGFNAGIGIRFYFNENPATSP